MVCHFAIPDNGATEIKKQEYIRYAQFIRNNSIKSKKPNEIENFFDQNGNIDALGLRLLIFDHLGEEKNYHLIQKHKDKYVFVLPPHFEADTQDEVFDLIVQNKQAIRNIHQDLIAKPQLIPKKSPWWKRWFFKK